MNRYATIFRVFGAIFFLWSCDEKKPTTIDFSRYRIQQPALGNFGGKIKFPKEFFEILKLTRDESLANGNAIDLFGCVSLGFQSQTDVRLNPYYDNLRDLASDLAEKSGTQLVFYRNIAIIATNHSTSLDLLAETSKHEEFKTSDFGKCFVPTFYAQDQPISAIADEFINLSEALSREVGVDYDATRYRNRVKMDYIGQSASVALFDSEIFSVSELLIALTEFRE
ncbi:MAG: hypothetical protein KDM63_14530 [Verrucomicrobiae bacterium]|nr:hypothetical protein [Verrucomicrobiae bacterium]